MACDFLPAPGDTALLHLFCKGPQSTEWHPGAQLFLGLGAGLELCHGATQEQPGPVRWEVLMMALQGQLKVGLDTEQACQGAVTHTRSTWQPQQPVTQPSLVAEVGAWEPVCAPPLLHYVNPNVY